MSDAFDSALRNPENSKSVVMAPFSGSSFAAIDTVEQLEALKHQPVQDADGNIVSANSSDAPIERELAALAGMRPPPNGGPIRLASAQGLYSEYLPGDKAYHRKHHEEVTVRRIGDDGRIRVKFPNGDKAWVMPESLVKL